MTDYPPEAWTRLGEAVRRRRKALRFDQTDAKSRSHGRIARATWSNIERGISGNYSEDTFEGLCIALDWKPNSVEAVLAGGQPTELTMSEVLDRAADDVRGAVGLIDKAAKLSPEDLRYVEGVIDGLLRDE